MEQYPAFKLSEQIKISKKVVKWNKWSAAEW